MITLHRIDAARNMYRFYRLSLQPDLLGGCQLVRTWGRIGTSDGNECHEYFPDDTDALSRMADLEAAKRLRGYC